MLTKEDLIHTVTIIHADDGTTRHTGTGCFVSYNKNGRVNYALISNEHILNHCDHFELYMPVIEKRTDLFISSMELSFKSNPACLKNYDIGAIPLNPSIDKLIDEGYLPKAKFIEIDDIITDNNLMLFNDIEKVLMIGYPHNLSYSEEKYPIVKNGITATSIHYKYNKKDEFLVDILNFNGSSGSPIFIEKNNIYYLAGIHYSKLEQDIDIKSQDGHKMTMSINIGLGINIKAHKLLTLF